MNDDVLTRNENEELAVRVVSATEQSTVVNPNDVYTRDTDGNLAVRVVGAGGGDQHNLGYYATQSALEEAHPTATAGDWAIVGTTDTVWIWDEDTSAWKDSDQKGQVTSVNGQTGAVTVQETLVSGTNIKSINGNSILGSGNLQVSGFLPFPAGWTTNSTTKALCDDIAADTTTVKGSAFLGEVTCSDLPAGIVNSEINVYINDGTTAANKVIILELTSGNVAPYRWIYVYWNGGTDTSGWKTWQETLVSGTNIKTINGESLLGSGNLSVGGIPQYTTMPTATSSNVGEIAQYSGATDATYTNGYFYKSTREQAVGTATISQTTGSSLSNLAVDVATFETQENTTGNYEFEAVEEQAEINFTDENGWEVELDANGIIQMLDNGGDSYFIDNEFNNAYIYQENGTDFRLYISSESYGTNEYDVTSYVTVLTQGTQDTTIATLSSISRSHTDWYYDNNVVDLADYGITYEGTPIDTDVITVAYTEGAVSYVWERTDVQPAGSGGIEWAVVLDKPANHTAASWRELAVWTISGGLPDGDYEYYTQIMISPDGGGFYATYKITLHKFTQDGTPRIDGYIAYVYDGSTDPRNYENYRPQNSYLYMLYTDGNNINIFADEGMLSGSISNSDYPQEIKGIYKISAITNVATGEKIIPTGHLFEDGESVGNKQWDWMTYSYPLISIPEQKTHFHRFQYLTNSSTVENYKGIYFVQGWSILGYQPAPDDNNPEAYTTSISISLTTRNGDAFWATVENTRTGYKAKILKQTGIFANSQLKTNSGGGLALLWNFTLPMSEQYIFGEFGLRGADKDTNAYIDLLYPDYVKNYPFVVGVETVGATITDANLGAIVQYNEEIPNVSYTKGHFYEATGTAVPVPNTLICTETTSTGTTITCTDVQALCEAMSQAGLGWYWEYIANQIINGQVWTYDADNGTLYCDYFGTDWDWASVALQYFTFSPSVSSGTVSWKSDYSPAHTEIQNPAWVRVNTQPSTTGTTGTLVVANWSSSTQTITVNGVTASNNILVSPAPASAADWASAGILCTAQSTDSLTFTCTQTPSNDITVNVAILN